MVNITTRSWRKGVKEKRRKGDTEIMINRTSEKRMHMRNGEKASWRKVEEKRRNENETGADAERRSEFWRIGKKDRSCNARASGKLGSWRSS